MEMRSSASHFPFSIFHFPFSIFHPPRSRLAIYHLPFSIYLAPMSTVLIGYRGSGKSSIGARLADRLWIKCVDTDAMVVAKAGKSIAALFQSECEARFRELESQAVREAAAMRAVVIALGG